jgi:hypothetical protein
MLPRHPPHVLIMLRSQISFVTCEESLKTGHTLARKKHGERMRHAPYVKVRGVIDDLLLAALHINDSFDHSAESSNLHRPIVTPDCDDINDRDNKGGTSDNEDYHPTSVEPSTPFTIA